MNKVAQRIQVLLDERNEKLKPVADAAGVQYYSVYHWWKRPHSKADYNKVVKFADYFNVDVKELYDGNNLGPALEEGESKDEGQCLDSKKEIIRQLDLLTDDDVKDLYNYLGFLRHRNKRPSS